MAPRPQPRLEQKPRKAQRNTKQGMVFEKADGPPARVTTISLPRSLVERIDDFRFERRLSSRAEAIRRLIEEGLQRAAETKRGSSS
jgi:hypothetical protein